MWQPDGWGQRARIGLLTPHNDVVPEGEFWAMAPQGVSIHSARVPFGWPSGSEPPPIGLDAVRVFAELPYLDEAAALLADAPLNVIAYGFTSSSYLLGPDGDAALKCRLERRTGAIPVVVPCPSAVLALRALGVQSLALVHPPWFPPELDRMGAEYFRKQGCEVIHAAAVGLAGGQLDLQPVQIYEWVQAHVPRAAEAVLIAGNGLRVIGIVHALEEALGRPVLTANQVLFWHALRLARVERPVVKYGQIFARELPS